MKEEEKEPNGFSKAKQQTEELLENGEKLSKLIDEAKEKAEEKKGKLKRLSSLKISAVVSPRTNKFANMETTIPKSATNPICRSKIFIKVFPILH